VEVSKWVIKRLRSTEVAVRARKMCTGRKQVKLDKAFVSNIFSIQTPYSFVSLLIICVRFACFHLQAVYCIFLSDNT